MAEFRKWTLHFDDGNNTVDGKRVQDPPGFTAGGGKELVLTWVAAAVINSMLTLCAIRQQKLLCCCTGDVRK